MVDIARILCPIDFSECSARALAHAAALARWYEAKVTVFHVFSVYQLPAEGMDYQDYATVPRPPVEAEDVVEQVRRFCEPLLAEGTASEIVVRDGNAVDAIVDQAGKMPSDLLVIGTHGRSRFDRLFFGSVTEKVLRKVVCPVLTVPPLIDQAVVGPTIFRTILCPMDFSPSSTRALAYALSLAEEANARLILLHVLESHVEDAHLGELAHFSVPEYHRHIKNDAMERLKALTPADVRDWLRSRRRGPGVVRLHDEPGDSRGLLSGPDAPDLSGLRIHRTA